MGERVEDLHTKILDNQSDENTLAHYLRRQLGDASALRVVSAYFSIFGFQALADELEAESLKEVRFLLGEPSDSAPITDKKEARIFQLIEEGLSIKNSMLEQKPLAKRCAAWIARKSVRIRTVTKTNFLHAKMYHIAHRDGGVATVGSSNFTQRGLGAKPGSNIELNLALTTDDQKTQQDLAHWFDTLWNDRQLTEDVKDAILESLRRLYCDYSPEIIYYKTLYELFYERVKELEDADRAQAGGVEGSALWNALYPFQRDGYRNIIHCLEKYNGCILADSVGLGKTYTALAVIRHYQRNEHGVLVLCPKRLEHNWDFYRAGAKRKSNPYPDIKYDLLFHTDLGRETGASGSVSDLADFDWGLYSLVVIDESHNFRNQSKSSYNADGSVRRISRYEKLFNDVIKSGTDTKVLLISATPVNTSLIDLRNQVNLIAAGEDDAFSESLGIKNFSTTLKTAQKEFEHWSKNPQGQKGELLDVLNGECRNLLYNMIVARTRRQIQTIYAQDDNDGKAPLVFPTRVAPKKETPSIDSEGQLSFNKLVEHLGNLQLSIYKPTNYAVSTKLKEQLEREKQKHNFDQRDRERSLVGMMATNLVKRLESSIEAFRLTITRMLDRMDEQLAQIEAYLQKRTDAYVDINEELAEDEQLAEDEDFFVSQRGEYVYHLSDINCEQWRSDIANDRNRLQWVLEQIRPIDTGRDGKLKRLKEIVAELAGERKRKLLIFTSFTDTANYLYEHLYPFAEKLGVQSALVTGAGCKVGQSQGARQEEVLERFAPHAHEKTDMPPKEYIDIIVATDCISEGQNLQDCNTVINYDIHWNPVRIIQRRGRIDRIRSPHKYIYSINFWPTEDIDDYLKLQTRFTARKTLVEATTGDMETDEKARDNAAVQLYLETRDELLRKMQHTTLDLEDEEDTIVLSDLTLSAYYAQLMHFLEKNRAQLENISNGAYAVAKYDATAIKHQGVAPRVIFLFRRRNHHNKLRNNPLDPHYLVSLSERGVMHAYTAPQKSLELFQKLASGQSQAIDELCRAFDREIVSEEGKALYNALAQIGQEHVHDTFTRQLKPQLARESTTLIPKRDEQPHAENLELITWLVIKT